MLLFILSISLNFLDNVLVNVTFLRKVLYVSGEESGSQIKLRAERLNALSENLLICSEICVEGIIQWIEKTQPEVLVLDSVQTFFTQDLQSAPGSIGQVREVAFKIFQEVKRRNLPTLLIGHINKRALSRLTLSGQLPIGAKR